MQIIKRKFFISNNFLRVCIISILLFICFYCTFYFHTIIKTGEGISHFFYIPIILSIIWWGKKGNIVAIFLALMLILADHLFGIGDTKLFDFLRGFMLVAVSYLFTLLIITIERSLDRIAHLNNMLRGFHSVSKLILNEDSREKFLDEICRALVAESGYRSVWIAIWDRHGKLISHAESGLNSIFGGFIEKVKQGILPNCAKWALDQNEIILTQDMKKDCSGCPLLVKYGDFGAMTLKLKNIDYGHGIISVTVPLDLLYENEARDLLIEISGIIEFSLKNLKLKKEHETAVSDLRDSEERFRKIIENAPFGYYRIGGDGIWQYVNPRWEKMYGISCTSIVGKHYQMTLPDIDKMKIHESFIKATAGMSWSNEFSRHNKNGKLQYYQYNSQPIYSHGKLVAIEGFLNDLTEIKRLQNEVMMVTARERQRIGQDLHDGLGQNLTAATFLLEALSDKTDNRMPRVNEVHDIISDAIIQTKNLSRILCPVEMEKDGLVSAIRRMAESTEKIFNVHCSVVPDDNFSVEDDQAAIHLFYVAREAVNNSIKHGSASNIEIKLTKKGDEQLMSIKDDGTGAKNDNEGEGMGLYIMQYRAQMIGADFSSGNGEEGGFMVNVRLR